MSAFIAGAATGGSVVLVLVLFTAVVLLPFHDESGAVVRAGYATGGASAAPPAAGAEGRRLRWEARSGRVRSAVESVARPLLSGVKFAHVCTELGFWIGISVTQLSFWLARKGLHLLGTLLAALDARAPSATLARLVRVSHLVDEVVHYAELITLFALRSSRLVVSVCLTVSTRALALYRVMPARSVASAALSAAGEACFQLRTLDALGEVLAMVLREVGPAAQALRLAELARAVRVLARYSSNTHSAAAIIRGSPARRPWHEVEGADELSHFVMLAVGSYGQMGLKFLGVVPYGSVASDTQAFAYCAQLPSTDAVVMSDFTGELYLPGYVVCIDQAAKSIVISVRGSIQPHDFLADLVCSPVEVQLMGVRGHAHAGMLKSARELDRRLRAAVLGLLLRPEHDDFRLVLTGHSLGAGAATLLAALWLSEPASGPMTRLCSRLRVVGYGTPMVVSPDIAAELASHVTTVVMGNDMVPRFSLASFQRLRDRALELWGADGELLVVLDADWWREAPERRRALANQALGAAPHARLAPLPELAAPGRIVWVDDHSLERDLRNINVLVSPTQLGHDMTLCDDMFASHLPQHYAALGSVPFPSDFI